MTRRIPLIVAAVAVLLTAAWWFVLYTPLRDQQARYISQTDDLEEERAELTSHIAQLREVEANAEDYESRLVTLTDYVPDVPAQPAALKELQRTADESGLEITEVAFSDPELVPDAPTLADPDTVLARIPMQMTVSGAYFQVVDLLRRVEVDLRRAVKIDTVALVEDEELSFPDLTVTWTGQAYAVLPLDEVGGAEALVIEQGDGGASEAPAGSEAPTEQATTAPPGDATPPDTSETGTS